MGALDKLIDLLVDSAKFFLPFVVIQQFEQGVVLRFGKFTRELDPGFHWVVPFGIDAVLVDNVVPRTHLGGLQSLVTRDGRHITLQVIVTAKIHNIRKALLEVEGVDHALLDSCAGAVATEVAGHTWEEIIANGFSERLTEQCRKGAWRYGVEVMRVQIGDLTVARAIRLLGSDPPRAN